MTYAQAKRLFDIVFAAIALVVLGPLLLACAAAVWWSMGWPIVFRQARAGLHGRPFTLCKLRTMSNARDDTGRLHGDAERLTPLGRFLRLTSLDELPELVNVLRGEMSLVGPRPLPVQYLPRYSAEQARRHEVLPGLTGWAQIHGRNLVDWPTRLALDVWYVDHRGWWLDLKILAMTVRLVVLQQGISAPGHETMAEFTGTDDHEAESSQPFLVESPLISQHR